MFFPLLKFEIKYLSRQLSWWFALLMLILLGFLLSGRVVTSGDVYALSPHNITYLMAMLSQIAIFTTTLITAHSALRDTSYDFSSFVQTKPIKHHTLILSRFTSLFLMSLLIVLGAITAILLPTLLINYDAEISGVFQLSYLLWPLCLVVLPNLLFTVSILFFSASIFKTTLATFISGIGIYIFYLMSAVFLDSALFTASDPIARGEINYASLLDPFAVSAFLEQTQFWTRIEKNTLLINLDGNFLYNRIIWILVSLSLLISLLVKPLSHKRRSKMVKRGGKKAENLGVLTRNTNSNSLNTAYKAFKTDFSHCLAFGTDLLFELKMTLRSLPFLLLIGLVAALSLAYIFNGMNNNFFVGVQYAYTSALLPYVAKPLDLVGLFIVILFSGEMVWRAKDHQFDNVLSVTPAPSWLYFLSKVTVMACLILLMIAVVISVGVAYQLWNGFYADDVFLFFSLVPIYGLPLLLASILSLSIHHIAANKYVGFALAGGILLVFKSDIAAMLGIGHNLLRFSDLGPHYYSDFSGYDIFTRNLFWFSVYWTAFTITIAIIAFGISKRSLEESILSAFTRLTDLLSKSGVRVLQLAALITLFSGSYIFYNTNIINNYVTPTEQIQKQLTYETALKSYKETNAPVITKVSLAVDFYPSQYAVNIDGSYWLVNQGNQSIERFLISLPNPAQTFIFSVDEDYRSTKIHDLDVIEVVLTKPLKPQSKLILKFSTELAKQGFKNEDRDISLMANGSYFHSSSLLPYIGYNTDNELRSKALRQQKGLPERNTLPALIKDAQYDKHGHEKDAKWIDFEAIISTDAEQMAFAPGELKSQWNKDGRAYFQYKVDRKISHFLGFASAKYQTSSLRNNDTTITAYFHPSHNKNIELMLNTAAESLEYFEQEYGPYPFPTLNLVEIPNRGFARAYPGTIFISEHVGFKEKQEVNKDRDHFSYLIAHEVAHQWWGHQLASAKTEGEVLLIESLADYSALMVMKNIYGESYVDKVMADSTMQYLKGRSADTTGETSLHKLLGQRYLRYHKGPVVFNAIRHLISEKSLNQALRALLSKKGNTYQNYATSLDLIREIKTNSPVQHHQLIDEWLTAIVTYDLSITNAEVQKLPSGKFQVTADLTAVKYEHHVNDMTQQKVFAHNISVGAYQEVMGELYLAELQSVQMAGTSNRITFTLDQPPSKLIVDPRYLFIDRNRIDNEINLAESADKLKN